MTNQLQNWVTDNTLSIPYNKELNKVAEEGAFYSTKYQGNKINLFIHHWGESMIEDAEHYEHLWAAADVVICCHPEHLPVWVRDKHPWPDHVGTLTGQLGKTHYDVYPT